MPGAGWQPQALDEAVQLFVSEMAPDLSCDVPNLEQILAKDAAMGKRTNLKVS